MQTIDVKDARIRPRIWHLRMAGADIRRMLPAALKAGFHIDTAQIYRNERGRRVVAASRITRQPLAPGLCRQRRRASGSSARSYRPAALHWPNDSVPLADQIGALNGVAEAGKAAISVSATSTRP